MFDPKPDADSLADRITHAFAHLYADVNPLAYAHPNPDPDRCTHPNCHPNPNPDSNPHDDPYADTAY